jgi:hypothetical protein
MLVPVGGIAHLYKAVREKASLLAIKEIFGCLVLACAILMVLFLVLRPTLKTLPTSPEDFITVP